MLNFFRKYQGFFFLFITVVVISSFVFFGAFDTFAPQEKRQDPVIGYAINGSKITLSEVQKLSRFIHSDRYDVISRGVRPNLFNDGVIRNDFLKTRLAEVLINAYFPVMKNDLMARLEKAKRFQGYQHPQNHSISVKTIWEKMAPAAVAAMTALGNTAEATPATFEHFAKLYLFQSQLHPEMVRRILLYQIEQNGLTMDPRLSQEDLALFGYHAATDWFGHDFVDLVALFIVNASREAAEKGYAVSAEEVKGDLLYQFTQSLQNLGDAAQEITFHQHLQMLGFDEAAAIETWQKVLLFRRYFDDVGAAAFVDGLPYRSFAEFACESALVQAYEWPSHMHLKNTKDRAELEFYIQAVAKDRSESLPTAFLPLDEIEKVTPELVQITYKADVASISSQEVALRPSLKEVWQWEVEEDHWNTIRKKWDLPECKEIQARFLELEQLDPEKRNTIDLYARSCIVEEHPEWIQEALLHKPLKEKIWTATANSKQLLQEPGVVYRIENLEVVKPKHLLTFAEARPHLARLCKAKDDAKNPFAEASPEALRACKANPDNERWLQTGTDPLLDQFRLEKKEKQIARRESNHWLKEQAFAMPIKSWSSINGENGPEAFFYLVERQSSIGPILDQIHFGKVTLASDAKVYVAKQLIQSAKKKNSIVIPIPREENESI